MSKSELSTVDRIVERSDAPEQPPNVTATFNFRGMAWHGITWHGTAWRGMA